MDTDDISMTSFNSRRLPASVSFMTSDDNIDLMTNRDIKEYIANLEVSNRLKRYENECLAEHVRRWRPEALKDLEYLMTVMLKAAAHFFHTPVIQEMPEPTEEGVDDSSRLPTRSESITSTTSLAYLENITRVGNEEKLRMVRIAMLGVREHINELHEAYWRERRHLDGAIENLEFMLAETREAHSIVDPNICPASSTGISAKNTKTQGGFTAEIFQFHVTKLLRDMDHKLERLRMVRANMHPTIEELRHTYERRRELAKELHAVDWEKLRMIRSKLRADFEQITRFWQETRHDVGYIGLDVHEIQRRVPRVRARKRRADIVLASRLERIAFSQAELPHVQKQISDALRIYKEKKDLKESYRGPTVMAYIQENCKLSALQREIAGYERKFPIRRVTLYNAYNMLRAFRNMIYHKSGILPDIGSMANLRNLDKKPIVGRVLGTFEHMPLLPKKLNREGMEQSLSQIIDSALFPESSKRKDVLERLKERCKLLDKGLCVNNAPHLASSSGLGNIIFSGTKNRTRPQEKPEEKPKTGDFFEFKVTKF